MIQRQIDLHKRTPLRLLGLAHEMHPDFQRRVIRLERIARDTGAHNVFPRGRTAAIARHDVIQIQILAIKNVAAVLAGVFVALENVVPGELHFLLRHPVKHAQQNHARHADAKGDRRDGFRMRLGLGKIMPLAEVISLERTVVRAEHGLGVTLKEQRERAAGRANIDGLPEAVEYQDVLV